MSVNLVENFHTADGNSVDKMLERVPSRGGVFMGFQLKIIRF